MSSAPHASNFYFNEPLSERLNERQDSTASSVSNKSVENPLLGRNPQSLINATTITTTTTRDAATATTVASHEANLRQRRRPTTGVTFLDDKENHNFPSNSKPVQQSSGMMTPPPLASVSLGTAMEGTFGLGSSYMPRTATYMGVRDRICLPSFSKIILVQLSSSLLSFSPSLFLLKIVSFFSQQQLWKQPPTQRVNKQLVFLRRNGIWVLLKATVGFWCLAMRRPNNIKSCWNDFRGMVTWWIIVDCVNLVCQTGLRFSMQTNWKQRKHFVIRQ